MSQKQARTPQTNVNAMLSRHMGCLPMIGLVIITITALHWMFDLTQFLHINAAYGQAAWHGGLRVIDNKGHLSNGGELTGSGKLIVYFGSYLLSVPFFLAAGFGLPYLRMRWHGERLSEQRERWQREEAEKMKQ